MPPIFDAAIIRIVYACRCLLIFLMLSRVIKAPDFSLDAARLSFRYSTPMMFRRCRAAADTLPSS